MGATKRTTENINIADLMNQIKEKTEQGVDKATNDSEPRCEGGVCMVTWKPQRPREVA